MRILRKVVFLLFISLVFIQVGSAKEIKKVAQTGLQFLKIDMSARSAGMGGAYTMVGNDASALFGNPAGISEMESTYDVFGSRVNWVADIYYSGAAAAANLGNLGTFGLHFMTSEYGEIIGTRVADNEAGYVETGNLDLDTYVVGFSYARRLTNKFTMGGTVKFTSQHLGSNLMPSGETVTNKVSGLGYDFGTIFYPGFRSLRVGMSIRNFSPQFKYEETAFELPLTFRIGFAMDVLDLVGGMNNHSLVVDLDAIHPRDYTERIHVGGEYWYGDIIALRAGYKSNYDEQGLSLGFGLKYEISGIDLKFNYAYSDFGALSNVNRITIGGAF